MIQSFVNKSTAAVFAGIEVRTLPRELQQRAAAKLTLLHAANAMDNLRVPPGNRLEKLGDDRSGQWSIRINDRWRICFVFDAGNAFDVEIVNYH
jgi:toxin HigB-1